MKSEKMLYITVKTREESYHNGDISHYTYNLICKPPHRPDVYLVRKGEEWEEVKIRELGSEIVSVTTQYEFPKSVIEKEQKFIQSIIKEKEKEIKELKSYESALLSQPTYKE